MTQPDIIQTILKDSNYHLDLFDESEIQALRSEILIQTVRGKKIRIYPLSHPQKSNPTKT